MSSYTGELTTHLRLHTDKILTKRTIIYKYEILDMGPSNLYRNKTQDVGHFDLQK